MFKITLTQKQAQAITSASLNQLKEVEEIKDNPKPNMTLSTYWLLLYNGLKTGTKKLEQEYNLYVDKLEQDEENQSKINELGTQKDLVDFNLLTKAMLAKLSEYDIKSLEEFVG